MTRYPEIKQVQALTAWKSDGTIILPLLDPVNGAGLGPGFFFPAGTFLFPLGGERAGSIVESVMAALSASWSPALSATLTIEGTCFPKSQTSTDQGPNDTPDWDIVSPGWQKIDPTQAGSVYAVASGTGVMTKYTCVVTAAAGGGGGFWNVPELGSLRLRLKAVVTVQGFLRVMGHSKLGS